MCEKVISITHSVTFVFYPFSEYFSVSYSFLALIALTKKRTTQSQSVFWHQTSINRSSIVTVSAAGDCYIRIKIILTHPYPFNTLCPHSLKPIRSYYLTQIFSIFSNYPFHLRVALITFTFDLFCFSLRTVLI